jgi:hypothetical protein
MQGGTPERRKRRVSGWQTLHISDPKLTLCLYCVVGKNVGGDLQLISRIRNYSNPVLNKSVVLYQINEVYGPQ